MKDLPSQQLDELKTVIFMYVVMAPLLSALFADKIDNFFVACLLFVGLVGTAFTTFEEPAAKTGRNSQRAGAETQGTGGRQTRRLKPCGLSLDSLGFSIAP